ncbi:HotDog domain-containing protein [Dendryphion nanum]|uniref:HotDog domain-containing protein n=1 Tax=Dendryphion nanum TaxID=256645 RepID=A0A9P9DIL0_9PLEO|nr:HotDog domain-containing protein [Dendryphion nanum]
MASKNDTPTKREDGRYDNVDFRKAAGYKLPVVKASYNRRDVLLFANAIGCKSSELHFLYELHPQFTPFPTFPINLPFKQTSQDVFDFFARALVTSVPGTPPFDPQRSVDGERGIVIHHPLPPSSSGLDLEVAPEIVGMYDKGGNMIQEMKQTLRDSKTGMVYAELTSLAFGIGQGGYGGPKGPATISYHPPKGRENSPDAIHTFQTTAETALLYRLCGDYNPIHADAAFAQAGGFPRAFLQGLGTWNIAAHGVLKELGNSDASRLRSFKARFARIVYPGDELETRMWRVGRRGDVEEVVFETVARGDEGERVVLRNGFVELNLGGERSRM